MLRCLRRAHALARERARGGRIYARAQATPFMAQFLCALCQYRAARDLLMSRSAGVLLRCRYAVQTRKTQQSAACCLLAARSACARGSPAPRCHSAQVAAMRDARLRARFTISSSPARPARFAYAFMRVAICLRDAIRLRALFTRALLLRLCFC